MRNVKGFLMLAAAVLALWPRSAPAQGYESITGKAFDMAMPKDFYLEGNRIPIEPRNAAILKSSSAPRILFALLDTTGYSSQIKQKYIGMIITEGRISVCGNPLEIGSYGFGLDKPTAPSTAEAKFHVYNQAGGEAVSCSVPYDKGLKAPKPLAVATGKEGAALLLGRYKIEIK